VRTSDRHDGDVLRGQVATEALGQALDGDPVAVSLDDQDLARG
jgi:hypothetical protein